MRVFSEKYFPVYEPNGRFYPQMGKYVSQRKSSFWHISRYAYLNIDNLGKPNLDWNWAPVLTHKLLSLGHII